MPGSSATILPFRGGTGSLRRGPKAAERSGKSIITNGESTLGAVVGEAQELDGD